MQKLISIILLLTLSLSTVYAQNEPKKEIKPALLVIDIQNAYLPNMDKSDKEMAIKYINWTIYLFEKYDLPIIRIYHQDKQWGPAEDSEEFQFTSDVHFSKEYPKVIKHYGNAFTKTNLDELLKEKGINTLFLCGLSATGCVMSTKVGASDHDYKSFMVKNALLSPNAEYTNVIEDIMSTMDVESITLLLENAL